MKEYKIKVTLRTSRLVQKICFQNNVGWYGEGKQTMHTEEPYLVVVKTAPWLTRVKPGEEFLLLHACERFSDIHPPEIRAEDFIRKYTKFKPGAKVINRLGEIDEIKLVPGMPEYDRLPLIASDFGFVLKKNGWEFQENWDLYQEKQAEVVGPKLNVDDSSLVLELSMDQIAAKFNVPVERLVIKKG